MIVQQEASEFRHETGASVEVIVPASPSSVGDTQDRKGKARSFRVAARTGWYIFFILAVTLVAGAYGLRKYGIFNCQASGYGTERYLGYCNATSYGDYDHGAIWFDLEPPARAAAANAQVLFLGNSRTGFAFSSPATAEWFSSRSESYFLLGFTYWENYTFEVPLLRKLHPKAKVYVINIDTFFERSETAPGKTVMRDDSANARYEEKRQWQRIHKNICTTFKAVCGDDEAVFRSRSTGAWVVTGNRLKSAPVSYDENIDAGKVATYTALAKDVLPSISADRGCTILTIVPTVKTDIGTANAIAAALGLKMVAPRVDGLVTFDGYHLNTESAQRWSTAFFQEAGPQIEECLSK